MDDVGEAILKTHPTTPEGFKAFASALLVYDEDLIMYEGAVMSHTLLGKLLRCLAGTDQTGGAS